MTVLLEVSGAAKAFGGNQVLTDVSFQVHSGEIVGLLGPNGSGKSTLLNAISGFTPMDAGTAQLDGFELTKRNAHDIVRSGIARTFQLPSMPRKMSVLEVTVAASTSHHGVLSSLFRPPAARQAEREAIERAKALLEELLLTPVKDLPAASISGGQKKLLSIACALMGSPRLLMLDEPTAGVHPNLRRDIVGTLKRLQERGITQIIVEHDMHFIREVCTRCIVLDRGQIVADCHPGELETNAKVLEAYLGRQERRDPMGSRVCKEAA
jgi:branched-chain amino acid transport system ATP-binding protein